MVDFFTPPFHSFRITDSVQFHPREQEMFAFIGQSLNIITVEEVALEAALIDTNGHLPPFCYLVPICPAIEWFRPFNSLLVDVV